MDVEVSNSTTTTTSFICRTIQLHTSIAKAIYNYGLRIWSKFNHSKIKPLCPKFVASRYIYIYIFFFFSSFILIMTNSEYHWQYWKEYLTRSKFCRQNSVYKPTCVTRLLYRECLFIMSARPQAFRYSLVCKRPFGKWLLHALCCV